MDPEGGLEGDIEPGVRLVRSAGPGWVHAASTKIATVAATSGRIRTTTVPTLSTSSLTARSHGHHWDL
jgi:hypothetical protein